MAPRWSSQVPPRQQHGNARRMPLRIGLLLAVALVAVVTCLREGRAVGDLERSAVDTAFLSSEQWDAAAQSVQADFPGAMPGPEAAVRVLKAVQPFGLKRTNVALAQSILSDGRNADRGHFSTILTRSQRGHAATLLKRYFGRSFFLGGLGGAPSDGQADYGSFLRRVPQDGHVLLIYGTHISFQEAAAEQSMGKLFAMKAYEAVEEEVKKIAHTDFGKGNLVLLGGVQINMPYPTPGYWLPLHFSIRSKTKEPVSLMAAFS